MAGAPPQQGAWGAPQQGYDPSMSQPGAYPPQGYQQNYPPQQGGGGYPPQQGGVGSAGGWDAQAQAEWDLAQLEEKKRLRDQQKKKEELDRIAAQIRHNGRSQEDNQGCANLLCVWGILNGMMWGCPLLGDVWWQKIWHGLSIDKMTIVLGLFNMKVTVVCKDTFSGNQDLCNAMKPFSDHEGGQWPIKDLSAYMCKKDKATCDMMEKMELAGNAPLVALPSAAAFEVLAVLLLYFYWNGSPSATAKNLAAKCGVMAWFSGLIGFAAWLVMCPYMQNLPRMWAKIGGQEEFANSSLFGLKETFTMPIGWSCGIMLVALVSSFIRFFLQWSMPAHINEPNQDGSAEHAKLMKDAEAMYDGSHKA